MNWIHLYWNRDLSETRPNNNYEGTLQSYSPYQFCNCLSGAAHDWAQCLFISSFTACSSYSKATTAISKKSPSPQGKFALEPAGLRVSYSAPLKNKIIIKNLIFIENKPFFQNVPNVQYSCVKFFSETWPRDMYF